jgi:hypothetical protein
MALRINDIAPDFTAETTQGTIRFHDYIGDGWAILFPSQGLYPGLHHRTGHAGRAQEGVRQAQVPDPGDQC